MIKQNIQNNALKKFCEHQTQAFIHSLSMFGIHKTSYDSLPITIWARIQRANMKGPEFFHEK